MIDIKVRTLAALGVGGLAILSTIVSASAQSACDILPKGYACDRFESSWLGPGNSQEAVCAGLVRAKYGNRPYAITAAGEDQRFRIPELRIDAQYKYWCSVILKPE